MAKNLSAEDTQQHLSIKIPLLLALGAVVTEICAPALQSYWTAFAILSRASSVPFMISFLIIPLNKRGTSARPMFHNASILVLLPSIGFNIILRRPVNDPSLSDTLINLFECSLMVSAAIKLTRLTVTSVCTILLFSSTLLTVRFCQYKGSLSASETIFHTA